MKCSYRKVSERPITDLVQFGDLYVEEKEDGCVKIIRIANGGGNMGFQMHIQLND